MGNEAFDNHKLKIDQPIQDERQNLLFDENEVGNFVSLIRSVDHSEGLVVALTGEWGTGKTSFINLLKNDLKGLEGESKIEVFEFNPWLFSDIESLVSRFFFEIATQLGVREENSKRLARIFIKYSSALSPIAKTIPGGQTALAVADQLANIVVGSNDGSYSLHEMRAQIVEQLRAFEHPLLIVIDDIDRLSPDEMQAIFKLVRLTGNFPNIIYLLVFDYKVVSKAIGKAGTTGERALEKIVQIQYPIPTVPQEVIKERFNDELRELFPNLYEQLQEDNRWSAIQELILVPLIKHMRGVRRFLVSSFARIRELEDKINVLDLLVLEAVRIFKPELFSFLIERSYGLFGKSKSYHYISSDKSEDKSFKQVMIDSFMKEEDLINALLLYIFPGHDRSNVHHKWEEELRVANAHYFNQYLYKVVSPELRRAELIRRLGDIGYREDAVQDAITALDYGELVSFVRKLSVLESAAKRFSTVFKALVSKLESRATSIPPAEDSLDLYFALMDLTRNNLVWAYDPLALVKELYSWLKDRHSYSSQFVLFDAAFKQIGSNAELEALYKECIEEIRTSHLKWGELEWCPVNPYLAAVEGSNFIVDVNAPLNVLKLVLYPLIRTRTTSNYSVHTISERIISWDRAIRLFGDESRLSSAIEAIEMQERPDENTQLYKKYLQGYRHEEW